MIYVYNERDLGADTQRPLIWTNHAIISSGIKRFVGAEMTQSYWRFQLMWKEKKSHEIISASQFETTIQSKQNEIYGIFYAITYKYPSANKWRAPKSMATHSFVIQFPILSLEMVFVTMARCMVGICEWQPKFFLLANDACFYSKLKWTVR